MPDPSPPTVARSSRAWVPMVIPLVAQSSFWSGVVGRPCHCRAGVASILLTLISLACVEADPYSGPLNVVMIVLDAARADHIGVYGYDRDTTPFIDAFADEAGSWP